MIYENITQTIGNTPIVKLGKLAPKGANIYVKLESFNPGGSVKVRSVLAKPSRLPQAAARVMSSSST